MQYAVYGAVITVLCTPCWVHKRVTHFAASLGVALQAFVCRGQQPYLLYH